MKKAVIFTVAISAFLLVGCSSGNKTPTATATPVPNQELSNVDPLLRQDGYVRLQLTDPALYAYLEERGKVEDTTSSSVVDPQEQKKIGLVTQFQKAYKYNISGSLTVVSATKIKVSLFNYNGACGPIKIALVNKNAPTKPLATVKEISAAVNQTEFSFDIPSNLSLIKFDNVGVYCPDVENPVSVADLVAK